MASSPRERKKSGGDKKKVMVAVSDSQLLHSVFEMAVSRVSKGDTLYVVTLGSSLLARSGREDQSFGIEKLVARLKDEFEKAVTDKGVVFTPVVKDAKKKHEIKTQLVELSKQYEVDELVVGYSTRKLFKASVATYCVTYCACNVFVIKKASKTT